MNFKILVLVTLVGVFPSTVAYMDSPKELIPGVILHDVSNHQYDEILGEELIESLKERDRIEYTYKVDTLSLYDNVSSNYHIFDENYNDRDEEAISQLRDVVKGDPVPGEISFEGKKRVVRIVSPYMKASYNLKNSLTNDVMARNYRTREERNEANHKSVRKYLDERKSKKTSRKIYELRSKEDIRQSFDDFLKPIQMIEYPINNPTDYNQLADTPGFPKAIPDFANKVYIHAHPPFLQGGGFVQLAFGGTKDELKPYIAEAKSNAKIIVDAQDTSKLFVKNYIDTDMGYADSLNKLLPRSIVITEDTTIQMGKFMAEQKRRPIESMVDEMYEREKKIVDEFNKISIPNESEDDKSKRYFKLMSEFDKKYERKDTQALLLNNIPVEVYSEVENRQLQERYLGRISYNERYVKVPGNYTFYIFDFGGNWNHPYSLGALVSPNEDYIIYFLQNG